MSVLLSTTLLTNQIFNILLQDLVLWVSLTIPYMLSLQPTRHTQDLTYSALWTQIVTTKINNSNIKIYAYISIIILNISDLSPPIKGQRPTGWIKKQNWSICCLPETLPSFKDRYHFRVKGWTKLLESNKTRKQWGIMILMLENIDNNQNTNEKEINFVLSKGIVNQEDILNECATNSGMPNFRRNLLLDLKKQINNNLLIVSYFNKHTFSK